MQLSRILLTEAGTTLRRCVREHTKFFGGAARAAGSKDSHAANPYGKGVRPHGPRRGTAAVPLQRLPAERGARRRHYAGAARTPVLSTHNRFCIMPVIQEVIRSGAAMQLSMMQSRPVQKAPDLAVGRQLLQAIWSVGLDAVVNADVARRRYSRACNSWNCWCRRATSCDRW